MSKWTLRIIVFAALLSVAWVQTSLVKFLERNSRPIDEVKVAYTPQPDPLIYALVNARCGEPSIGRLGKFLECRDRVYMEIF